MYITHVVALKIKNVDELKTLKDEKYFNTLCMSPAAVIKATVDDNFSLSMGRGRLCPLLN